MEHRAEILKRHIDHCRQRLSMGVSEILANVYRRELALAETQLVDLEEKIRREKTDTAEPHRSH